MPNQRVVLRARANPKPILCRLSIFDRYVRSCDVVVSYLLWVKVIRAWVDALWDGAGEMSRERVKRGRLTSQGTAN